MTFADQIKAIPNLRAFYRFSEAVSPIGDWSLNSKIASPVGNPTLGALGPFADEHAVVLNGTNQRIDTTLGITSASAYSLGFWYKGTDTKYATVLSARGSGPSISVFLGGAPVNGGTAGQVHFGVSGGSIWSGRRTSVTINDDLWHYVVCVMAQTTGTIPTSAWTIYVDKVAVPLTDSHYVSTSTPINSGDGTYSIGQRSQEGGGYLGGALSNVWMAASPVTAVNVSDQYDAAMAETGTEPEPTPRPNYPDQNATTYGYLNGGLAPLTESRAATAIGYENIGYTTPPSQVIDVPQIAWGAAVTPGGPRKLVVPDIAAAETAYEEVT